MSPLFSSTEGSRVAFPSQDSRRFSVMAEGRVNLPRNRDAPRLARRSMQLEAGATLDHLEQEMVDILMTELVSNAVVHPARQAGSNVILRFAVSPECIRVEVHDDGEGFSLAEVGKPRGEPGGYGLVMVDRGASRWGASADDGNCVWFELDRGTPSPAA